MQLEIVNSCLAEDNVFTIHERNANRQQNILPVDFIVLSK
jgi:hypothetical protein